MTKKSLQNIISLTQECLYRYWQLDCAYVLRFCDEDVTWIGAVQSQFMQGYAQVKQDFENTMKELQPCHLLNQEFIVAQQQGNTCTIIGRYLTTTDDNVQYYLQVQQRCTFVWEIIAGEPKIKHLHISNPMGELKVKEDELFVNSLGKMTQRYLQEKLESIKNRKTIIIEDENGSTRFLLLSEILYATAETKFTVIHLLSQCVRAKMCISEFAAICGEHFIMAHRSFVVNSRYIIEIKRYSITMTDQSNIPIPVKKYEEVKQKVMRLFD